jgi:hypothetical protein
MVMAAAIVRLLSAVALESTVFAQTGPADDRPAIEVKAYVPTINIRQGESLELVLEVINNSPLAIEISNHPLPDKTVARDVKPITARRLPTTQQTAVKLYATIATIYPNFTDLLGYAIREKVKHEFVACAPGKSVLIKMYVPKEIMQVGDCDLLVTLAPIGTKVRTPGIARSQSIPIHVEKP